jgi:hypothetical protein
MFPRLDGSTWIFAYVQLFVIIIPGHMLGLFLSIQQFDPELLFAMVRINID